MHQFTWIAVAAAALALGCAAARAGGGAAKEGPPTIEFPQLTISNDVLKITLYLPDSEKGYYRGTRFDWSGMISRAEFKGRTVFGPFRTRMEPTLHDHAVGPAEEFDPDSPPGYADAAVGRPFLKIGVGLIEKGGEDKYGFWNPYKLARPGAWTVTSGKDWVLFEQELGLGGWAYRYAKRISLKGLSFSVAHTLRNTGTKFIDTTTYCHNFTIIDDDPVGPDYRVILPFSARVGEGSRPAEAEVDGRRIVFRDVVKGSVMLFLGGMGGGADDNAGTVENTRTGTALAFKGDRPLVKYNFYAEKTAACPEPFVRLRVEPGREEQWQTVYTLAAPQGK
jgi:hypothetical protein